MFHARGNQYEQKLFHKENLKYEMSNYVGY